MVKTPTQSFPKFSFPLSNYWGLYTIPNYWVIASGTPSAPPYTSFVFGKNFFCVWKYFFLCLEILFVSVNTFSWSSSIFTPNLSPVGIFTHARLTASTQSWSHILRSGSARKIPLDHRKRDWMNIAEVSITNIRYVSVTEQKNVNVYFRGAAR